MVLQNVLGKSSSTIYAIALLASGQSSAITGTYAGQYIMQVHIKGIYMCTKLSLINPNLLLVINYFSTDVIFQGFLDLKMRKWIRNLITRSIAITPSLIVSIIGGSSGAARLVIIASVRENYGHILIVRLINYIHLNVKLIAIC